MSTENSGDNSDRTKNLTPHRFQPGQTNPMSLKCILAAGVLTLAGCAMVFPQTRAPSDGESGPVALAMQPYLAQHEITGAVTLVATKDRLVDLEATGYSDVAMKKPMRVDDLFWIASMTKAMTTA